MGKDQPTRRLKQHRDYNKEKSTLGLRAVNTKRRDTPEQPICEAVCGPSRGDIVDLFFDNPSLKTHSEVQLLQRAEAITFWKPHLTAPHLPFRPWRSLGASTRADVRSKPSNTAGKFFLSNFLRAQWDNSIHPTTHYVGECGFLPKIF